MSVFYSDRQGFPGFFKDTEDHVLATEAPDQIAWAEKMAAELGKGKGRSIAFVGGGFCLLPRRLDLGAWLRIDIYEREKFIVDWVKANRLTKEQAAKFHFRVGDYKATLSGLYDVVVFHLSEPPGRDLLTAHLAKGGRVIFGDD